MVGKLDIPYALTRLRKFVQQHERLPSLAEIAVLFHYASRNSAVYLVNQLIEYGYLKKDPRGALLPTPKFKQGVRLLGTIAAGFPRPEEEQFFDTITLDDFLVKRPTETYMLEVSGDSMIEAGIMPRDYVLVEKEQQPENGDIVVARIDENWTLKFFRQKPGKVYLEAANPKYPLIYPEDELQIAGVVVSVVRRYN